MKRRSAQKFMVGFLTMLAAGTLPGSAYTVSADSMDFVEYDMTTGAETYFTVTVPGEDTGDFTMQGLAGEPEDADGDLTMPGYQGRPDPTPATATKKNCWVKKGSYYYYYNSRGKLLRNGTYQIKGKNYCFDKYGRRRTGKILNTDGSYSTFSKKTGEEVSRYFPLKITSILKNTLKGIAYKADKNHKRNYEISLKRVKLVDVKNHDITTAELKKGSVVRLFVKSTGTGQNRKDKITKIQAVRQLVWEEAK